MSSLIKINELPPGALEATTLSIFSDTSGNAYQNTLTALSNFIDVMGSVSYRGGLAIADTPTLDGWYFATETGTYVNAGSLIVDIADGLSIIIVSDTQTTFEQFVIPIDVPISTVLDPDNITEATSGKAVADYVNLFDYEDVANSLRGSNTIPSLADSLLWLDGTILNDEGTYYLVDVKNGYNFLITDYDFNDDWTLGFPYKSISKISAPAGNATLIAADVNNYLYDGGGVPNEIPVVSLFENVDYANKLFCRHSDQILSLSTGDEIQEPFVRDIVLYDAAREDVDLEICNTYFGVPVENETAIWVSPTGNDTTGDGTKLLPYATITKGNTEADLVSPLYIMTGVYDFGGAVITPKLIEGIGMVSFTNMPASNAFFIGTGYIKRLIVNPTTNGYLFLAHASVDSLAEKIYSDGYDSITHAIAGTAKVTIKNCVLKTISSSSNTINSLGQFLTVDTCYIEDNSTSTCVKNDYAAGLSEVEVNFCKINSSSPFFCNVSEDSSFIKIKGNEFVSSGIVKADMAISLIEVSYNEGVTGYIEATGSTGGDCNVFNNNIENNESNPMIKITGKGVEVYSNVINVRGDGGFVSLTSTIAINANFYNNKFIAHGDSSAFSIGTGVNSNTITGSYRENVMIQNNMEPSNIHGIQVFNHANFDIYRNRAENIVLAFIYKGDTHDNTGTIFEYNLVQNGTIVVKGVENLTVNNNTVVNDNAKDIACFDILINVVGTADNNIIKNNIFYTELSSGTVAAVVVENAGMTIDFDNNVIFTEGLSIGKVVSTFYDWASWQGLGYEASGVNADPLLTNFIPKWNSESIGAGINLGVSHDEGLYVSTNWGVDTVLPVIVTKEQVDPWDCGAYVS